MSKDIDELVRWRDQCEALAASLQRKVRHCDEITEERDKALRERDAAQARVIDAALIHAELVRERDEARAEVERLTWERDEARANYDTAASVNAWHDQQRAKAERERDEARAEVARMKARPVEAERARLDIMWQQLVRERDEARASVADAYRRGAEAMRDAAANALDMAGQGTLCDTRECEHLGRYVRDLPIPEEP